MPYTDYLEQVQKMYIGYYNRPADPGGLVYWANKLDANLGNINAIIEPFANSPESVALYGTIDDSTIGGVVDKIYNGLFNRDAEPDGKAFYVNGFINDTFTAATIMLRILNGAQNEDLLSVNNKVAAADLFTETIDSPLDGRPPFQATYNGILDPVDITDGRFFLSTVTWNTATIPTQGEVTTFIQDNIADPGDPILIPTFALSSSATNVNEGSPVYFTLDTTGIAAGSTYPYVITGVDVTDVVGGLLTGIATVGTDGKAIIPVNLAADAFTEGPETLTVTVAGQIESVTVNDTSTTPLWGEGFTPGVDHIDVSTPGTPNLLTGVVDGDADANTDGSTFTAGDTVEGIGSTVIRLVVAESGNAAYVPISDVSEINLINGVGGTPTVDFLAVDWSGIGSINLAGGADGLIAYIAALEDGVDLSVAVDVAGEISADYQGGMYVDLHNDGDGGISFIDTNVDMAVEDGASGWAYFSGNADIVIGDVTGVGTGDAFVGISGDSITGDVTIGDVSLVAGDGGYAWLSFTDIDGNFTQVGDVTVTVGDYNGTTGTASVTVSATGDIVMGNVTVSGGSSASAIFDVSGSGDVTVGNLEVTGGFNASVSVDIDASGDITVLDLTASGGNNATVNVDIDGTSGTISMSDVVVTGGTAADVDVDIDGSSDIEVDSLTATVGANATIDITIDASDITIGDVTASGLNNAQIDVSIDGSADVEIGDVNISAGDSPGVAGTTMDVTFSVSGEGVTTIGDVTVAAGDDYSVSVSISNDDGSDLTVGDIDVKVGDYIDNSADVNLFVYNVDATGDLTIGNPTGDVAVAVEVGISGSLDLEIGNTGTATTTVDNEDLGNLTVGNIEVTVGEDSFGSIDIYNYNTVTATSDDVGALTIGDIDIVVRADATASLSITQGLYGTSGGILGDVTIGDLNVTLGIGANFTASEYLSVSNTANGDVGAVEVGDITIVGDDGAYVTLGIDISASDGNIGSVTVGDVRVEVGVSGTINYIEQDVYAAGDIGDVIFGDMTIVLGEDATMTQDVIWDVSATGEIESITIGDRSITLGEDVYASGTSIDIDAGGNVGTIDIGDLVLDIGDSATADTVNYVYIDVVGDLDSLIYGNVDIDIGVNGSISDTIMYFSLDVTGDVGSIVFGDHDIDLGVNAYVSDDSLDINIGGDLGSIEFGFISVHLSANATYSDDFYRTIDVGGTIGDVTFGDITLIAHTGASFETDLYLYIWGDEGIGSVAIGNVDIQNLDALVYHALYVDINATSGDVGAVTILDVSLLGTSGTYASMTVDIYASGTLGDVTVGDIDLIASSTAGAYFHLDLSAGTYTGDVAIGNVSFSGTTGSTLSADIDAESANVTVGLTIIADVTATADLPLMGADYIFDVTGNDIFINNINLDITAEDTVDLFDAGGGHYSLTNLLTSVSASGNLTLGTIDLSDYVLTDTGVTTGASIDVSAWDGDITIIGTERDDTITDNTETNTLTGGDGEDIFSFVVQANKTISAVDVITDFEHAVDTIEFDVTVPGQFTADAYYEGTYATFTAFMAGALTQMTSVPEDNLVAGKVGSDVYVAIDLDNGDAVDTVVKLVGVSNLNNLDFADFNFI